MTTIRERCISFLQNDLDEVKEYGIRIWYETPDSELFPDCIFFFGILVGKIRFKFVIKMI